MKEYEPIDYREQPIVRSFLPKEPQSHTETNSALMEKTAVLEPPIVKRLREGLSLKEFRTLQKLLLVTEVELGGYIGVSPATLHRRKKSKQFNTPESERILRLARLFGRAMEVFGSEEAAREWLKATDLGLGESPLSYADTEFGAREVEKLLGRIDHGIFS